MSGISVPATGGRFTMIDDGVMFPRADVDVTISDTGALGVDLSVAGAGATFTPAEARRLADILHEKADLAERGVV